MKRRGDKKKAAGLWIKGKLNENDLGQIFSREEIKDLKFGKRWIEEMVESIN